MSRAIPTALAGVQLGQGLEGVAEQMGSISLVRNLVSKEGDHDRGGYLMKTGYRPDPTVVHASIGAICCHQLPVAGTDIPRHISITPDRFVGRGGMLGNQYDAFKTFDPREKVPDVIATVNDQRVLDRLSDERVVEDAFAEGRDKPRPRCIVTWSNGPER